MNSNNQFLATSSTDCLTSNEGSNSAFSFPDSGRILSLNDDQIGINNRSLDDAESLFVHAKTEVSVPISGVNTLGRNGNSNTTTGVGCSKSNSSSLFCRRGLSKSASQLLSQNNQTLSDLLNVEGGEKNEAVVPAVDLSITTHGDKLPQRSTLEDSGSQLDGNELVNQDGDYYLNQIRDLERQLHEKENYIKEREESLRKAFHESETLMKIQWKKEKECLEKRIEDVSREKVNGSSSSQDAPTEYLPHAPFASELTADNITRYSRQLLLDDGFGIEGQKKLLSSSVLVVGAGGIGSTALLYLAAAGVGNITVVDFDSVEMSNLHRQVIHKDSNSGMNKAASACSAITDLNPTIQCTAIQEALTFENALDLISKHDCVVDACDNPMTRYLVNDACVLSGTPLVSGSAMGTEGQLSVYNYIDSGCYRCMYPKAQPSEACKSCSDNGVLGTVPGLIGMLEATETLKILTGIGETMNDHLLMYDSLQCSFMRLKKQPRRKECVVCGPLPSIYDMQSSKNSVIGRKGKSCVTEMSISSDLNISCEAFNKLRQRGDYEHVLIDVRVSRQYEMCSLEGSVNIPLTRLKEKLKTVEDLSEGNKPVYCICRRGIASVQATKILSNYLSMNRNTASRIHSVFNVVGGYNSWAKDVDPSFPNY